MLFKDSIKFFVALKEGTRHTQCTVYLSRRGATFSQSLKIEIQVKLKSSAGPSRCFAPPTELLSLLRISILRAWKPPQNFVKDIRYALYALYLLSVPFEDFEESGKNLRLAERGIIFIDEIDKKREQESSGGRDINGTAVQEELLKILEPNIIDVPLGGGKILSFDTSRLTVIMGGAFVGIEKIIQKRLNHKSLGFVSTTKNLRQELTEEDYTHEDIIQYGFIPEFVGRTLMIAVFRKLTADDIEKIIFTGKRSPYTECTRYIANTLNVKLLVSKKFLRSIAEELAESKTGARALRSRMTNFFRPIIQYAYEHLKDEGVCTVFEDGTFKLEYDDVVYYG